jgi:hypothetical protein
MMEDSRKQEVAGRRPWGRRVGLNIELHLRLLQLLPYSSLAPASSVTVINQHEMEKLLLVL